MRFEYSYSEVPPALTLPVRISVLGATNGPEIKGKIDTGAYISVIPEELRKGLRLLPQGYTLAKGVFDKEPKQYPTFFVALSINNFLSFDLEVISLPRTHVLIGRDLLNQIVLRANGPLEFFELTKETN